MRHFFKGVLQSGNQDAGAGLKDEHIETLASHISDAVATQEFADLYGQRIGESSPHGFDLGAGENINILWSKTMTAFTDAMTAVVATFKATQAAVDPAHIASIDASIQSLSSSETADAANIADIQAGLKILTDGLGATSTSGSTGTSTGDGSNTGSGTAPQTGASDGTAGTGQ